MIMARRKKKCHIDLDGGVLQHSVDKCFSGSVLRSITGPAWMAVAVACLAAPAQAQTFRLDSRASFLRLGSGASQCCGSGTDAPVIVPTTFDLTALGIAPGDTILLEELGDFRYSSFDDSTDTTTATIAVFSSSRTIITGPGNSLGPDAYDTLNRIPGAIAAGTPVFTGNTLFGNLPTDIPEDFQVDVGPSLSFTVTVPTGAAFLFVTTWDSHYSDNVDPDDDYGVRIRSIPEPSTLVLLGCAAGAALVLRRPVRRAQWFLAVGAVAYFSAAPGVAHAATVRTVALGGQHAPGTPSGVNFNSFFNTPEKKKGSELSSNNSSEPFVRPFVRLSPVVVGRMCT